MKEVKHGATTIRKYNCTSASCTKYQVPGTVLSIMWDSSVKYIWDVYINYLVVVVGASQLIGKGVVK